MEIFPFFTCYWGYVCNAYFLNFVGTFSCCVLVCAVKHRFKCSLWWLHFYVLLRLLYLRSSSVLPGNVSFINDDNVFSRRNFLAIGQGLAIGQSVVSCLVKMIRLKADPL